MSKADSSPTTAASASKSRWAVIPNADTDRRGFLRGGLKAALIGAGGVLLPMQGRSPFSFPNIAALPDIPVIAKGFAPSAETVDLRRIHEALREHITQDLQTKLGYDESQKRYAALIRRYGAVAQQLAAKKILSWEHVAELAEVAWFWAPKAEAGEDFSYYTGDLALHPKSGFHAKYHNEYELAANAALIEAVLTLSQGAATTAA
jgi:hypothetical protein